MPRAVGVTVVSGFSCSEPKGLIGSGLVGLMEAQLSPPPQDVVLASRAPVDLRKGPSPY